MKFQTLIMAAVVIAFCGSVYAEDMGKTPTTPPQKAAPTQAVYVCPKCDMAADKPGKCSMCGAELQKMHLLGTKDGKALLCSCGAECNCDYKGMKDGKCACGKEVKTASIKGMYYCPTGCPVVSDKAGKCPGCGAEMKKAE